MKNIPLFILIIAVTIFIVWEGVNTHQVMNELTSQSEAIYSELQSGELNEDITNKIIKLENYWTKKMDTLAISISKKDLQPVSDYLQYLVSAVKNDSVEDALTYARLLDYNVAGLKEANGISWMNLL